MFNRSRSKFGKEEKKKKNNLTCKQHPSIIVIIITLLSLSLLKDEAHTNTSDSPKPDMSQASPTTTPTLDPLPEEFEEVVQLHAIDYELPKKKKKRKSVNVLC